MPTSAVSRARIARPRIALGVLGVVAALVMALAACSSSAPAELTSSPAVTGNGRHYSYDAGSLAQSSWPKACSLLSTDSAAAAIGTGVRATRFHQICYYTPTNDTFPTLSLTILGIGTAQRSAYNEVRSANARYKPVRVHGVGKAAVSYELSGSPTVNLDVLADQGLFEFALRSPVGNKASVADARAILGRVGTAVAGEFAG